MYFFDIEIVVIVVALVVMLFLGIVPKEVVSSGRTSLISRDTSTVMKAWCCIIIIAHHFALRADGGAIVNLFAMGGGNLALFIFLLLSAYGITKSELSRPTNFLTYVRHRLPKLILPFFLIMAVFILVYWLMGVDMPEGAPERARVNKMFFEISSHRATLLDCLSCFVGIKSINGSLWFVGVTAFQYVAFGLAKSIFNLREQRILVLQFYALLLALFGYVTFLLDFPAHYWRNLWALVLGLAVALYEKELLIKGLVYKILLWVGVNIFAFVYIKITHSAGIRYMESVNVGLFIMCGVEYLLTHCKLKKGSAIVWLGALSYYVYLVHEYLITIEWCTVGYISVLLTVAVCILVAWLFSQAYTFLQRCCGNAKNDVP